MDKYFGPDTHWSTQAKFFAWLRGGLRRGVWMRHPVKLDKLKAARYKAPIGRGGKDVWALECEQCKKEYRQSDCQVDHKHGNIPLKTEEDIQGFVSHLAFVSLEDLQILCKTCHSIKSMAERYDMTFKQAARRKEEIRVEKERREKKKASKQTNGSREAQG